MGKGTALMEIFIAFVAGVIVGILFMIGLGFYAVSQNYKDVNLKE